MSQPAQKPAASPRPQRAAAARHTQEHVPEKNSGSPSRSGEKKGEDQKKATSHGSSQPSRIHAGGTAPASKVSASSAPTSKSSSMNPTGAKAVKTEPEKLQSTKPPVVHEKQPPEVKPKEHTEPKSLPKHTSDTRSKHAHKEKAVSRSSGQPTPESSTKPTTKSGETISAGGKSVVANVAAASGKSEDKEKKENKSSMSAVPVESKPDKPSEKSGMDAALDDLIDTLGEPEETEQDNATYAGPEVSDPMSSTYIEELGKREVTIPPKYRELLDKKEGVTGPPPDPPKPAGPDEAIDALSSDFTCSSPAPGGKKTEKKSTGEVLKAESAMVIKSAVPPREKKRKVEEDTMSDQALEALSESLGRRKSEPEPDLSSVKEVDEAKAKEEKLKKCGEDDETVPSEYRLKPATDKDGKPLLPEPEKKSKPLSESELIDELSEDFDQAKRKEKQSKPTEKTEDSRTATPAAGAEAVPRASMCSIQSAPPKPAPSGLVPDDAVEALAGSLGKREAGPEEGKPVEDKVKEKAKEEDREKLGEKEETIPPDYRLEEVKDKDGKPLLPKASKESPLPLDEDILLDALSEDFTGPPSTASLPFEHDKLSAAISELVSQTAAPAPQSSGPPPDTSDTSNDKEIDDALDELADRLGHRQPDPDEGKPIRDKVKEKVKAEHRDKLGERDDTIPPEYRHLLDNDKGKPVAPPTEKPKESKKPEGDRDPIDALSGDFDNCPPTTETSENTVKDKEEKTASISKAPKNKGKAKTSAKAKEETSKPKADEENTS